MIALIDNKIIGATINALTENPDYDFTTAFNDDRLSRVGRTVDDSAQYFDFDILTASAVNKLMIMKHNLTAGATIALDGFVNNPLVDPTVMSLPLVSDALDISGNGNNGTPTDITWTGGVANFNGVSSRIVIGDLTAKIFNKFSICFKIRNDGSGAWTDIMGFSSVNPSGRIEITSANHLSYYDAIPSVGFLPNSSAIVTNLTVGEWVDVCIVADGATVKTYRNSILAFTHTQTGNLNANNMTLGMRSFATPGDFSKISMSNFLLTDRPLTTAEIGALYAVNNYFTPDYTTPITYNADYIYKDLGADQTFRYWRLSISDASNPDTYLEISKIYLGSFVQFPHMKKDQKIPIGSTSESSISASGQIYGNFGYYFRYGSINFTNITNTERQAINTAYKTIDKVKPFYLLIWESDLLLESPIYSVLTADLQFTRIDVVGLKWDLALSFREIF